MELNVFKTKREQSDAREALPGLIQHPGWKFLVRALELNAAHFNETLRDRKDFKNLEEVYQLQDRINDLEAYKDLPANLLAEIALSDPAEEDDTYDSPPEPEASAPKPR